MKKIFNYIKMGVEFIEKYNLFHWTLAIFSFVCLLVRVFAPDFFSAEADRGIAICSTYFVFRYSISATDEKNHD